MSLDLGDHGRIEGDGEITLEKGGDMGCELFPAHSDEVTEEEALHRPQAQETEGRQRHAGQKPEQPDSPPAFALQHEIAEKRLGVEGQQGVIEVEKGEAPVHEGGILAPLRAFRQSRPERNGRRNNDCAGPQSWQNGT